MILRVSHPDHPKEYARWTVIIGGGKSPIKWAKKPPTTRKSTAQLSHIAKVRGRLERALARVERLRVLNAMLYPLSHGRPLGVGLIATSSTLAVSLKVNFSSDSIKLNGLGPQ